MTDYLDVLDRIKHIYNSMGESEKQILLQILREISETGQSKTYEDLWLVDYKEIPVDKYTFLTDDRYLGKSNDNGKSIYPRWLEVFKELEDAGNQYYEIVFTGATRTGKTSTAVSDGAYQLYRLMCLRDPQKYFGLKSVTNISVFFFNLTATLARGVAYKEFNSTLAISPWFMEHGKMNQSESHPTYIPEGGLISIEYGSDAAHALGKATYCVVGDTKIKTKRGYECIQDLQGLTTIAQLNHENKIEYTEAQILCTGQTDHTISIYLEDGSKIEGTPEHKVMLFDGSYEVLEDLTTWDALLTIDNEGTISSNRILNINHSFYKNEIPVYDVINVKPFHNFIVYDKSEYVLHNCVIFDEVNFSQAGIKDIEKSKQRMKAKYDTLVARVTGTFVRNGEVFGKLYVISSKNSDSDFMEEYIQKQKEANNQHMYIFDEPQWKVWPKSKYSSDKMFHIALGGKKLKSFVVPDETSEEGLQDLISQGYQLMEVPEDNKTRFLADFDIALRDIGGVSVPGTLSYITQDIINNCIGNRKNPFFNDVLEIGTKDNLTIEEFFHIDVVDAALMKNPMFIHLDLSLNTDRTGISGVCISGRKDIKVGEKTMSVPTFTHVFSIALEAPRGDKIPYDKITSFIVWLRYKKFNIEKITRDQFQSEYMGQLLEQQGFGEVSKLSLDRTPDGYMSLRSVLLEQRIDMLDCQLLQDELIHLQRDANTGKIDHLVGKSKDVSDSFAGSVWSALLANPAVQVSAKTTINAMKSVTNFNRKQGMSKIFIDPRYRK